MYTYIYICIYVDGPKLAQSAPMGLKCAHGCKTGQGPKVRPGPKVGPRPKGGAGPNVSPGPKVGLGPQGAGKPKVGPRVAGCGASAEKIKNKNIDKNDTNPTSHSTPERRARRK